MRGSRHEPETPWASFSDVLSGMLFVFVITTFWFAWRLAMAEREAADELDPNIASTPAPPDAGLQGNVIGRVASK